MWNVYKKILNMNQRIYMTVDERMSSIGIAKSNKDMFSLMVKRCV